MNILLVLFYVIVFAAFIYGTYKFLINIWFYLIEKYDFFKYNIFNYSTSNNDVENYIDDNSVPSKYYNLKKKLMTPSELSFYRILNHFNDEYIVLPQFCLASIIEKTKHKFNTPYSKTYQNDLFKIIDFAIFKKDFSECLLLIELNDISHKQKRRKDRDLKVKRICKSANIKLITFYTNMPNEYSYVINRINQAIKGQ